MNHLYLFQPGLWLTKGCYYDQFGQSGEAEGETEVIHEGAVWKVRGFMELKSDEPERMDSHLEIEAPLPEGDKTTLFWVSQSPDIGTIRGHFVVVNRTILSSYVSDRGNYHGHECFTMLPDGRYTNQGCAFQGLDKLSSWDLLLQRK